MKRLFQGAQQNRELKLNSPHVQTAFHFSYVLSMNRLVYVQGMSSAMTSQFRRNRTKERFYLHPKLGRWFIHATPLQSVTCRLIPHRETTGPPLSTCYATLQLSPSESLDRPWDVNKNKGSRYCHLRGFTPCCLIDKKSIFDLINLSNHCYVQFDIQRNIIGWELLIHSFYI